VQHTQYITMRSSTISRPIPKRRPGFEAQGRDASTNPISIDINSIDSAKKGDKHGWRCRITMKIRGFQPQERDALIGPLLSSLRMIFTESTQLKAVVSSRAQREKSGQREKYRTPEKQDTHSCLTALAGKRERDPRQDPAHR
jgi:hypothetical protein